MTLGFSALVVEVFFFFFFFFKLWEFRLPFAFGILKFRVGSCNMLGHGILEVIEGKDLEFDFCA